MKDLSLPKLHFKVFFCFVLISALLILAPGCGGKKSEQTEAENDADSTDEDFDTVEEDTEGTEEEIEETEENSDNDNGKPDIDIEPLPKPDTDSDADNDSDKPTRTECRKVGGTWDESDETCYKIHDCDSKPENTTWNGWYRYTQYFEDGKWSGPVATEYNEEAGECHYICIKNYFWEDEECKNICDSDPCAAVEHSDGICATTTPRIYYCGCDDGYRWNEGKCKKITSKLSLGNICSCQSECYKDFFFQDDLRCTDEGEDLFGQDAVYAGLGTCVRKNYSIKETGIENENIIVDKNLNLEWQETVPEETYSWKDAVDYCKNLEYGGYDDWRIPAPKEIFSILTKGRCDTETTDSYFKERYAFLTSKTYAGDPNQAWYADDSFGNMSFQNFSGNKKIHVRCVRGETIPEAAFILSTVGSDEIVTDSATGLIWQKGHAAGKRWKEALEYCENLDYAGYTDWRLPNINELVSLMNYDKHIPASDFPDIPLEYFWSSTTAIPSSGAAWSVFIYTAQVISKNKDIFYYVKCVR